MLVSKEYLFFSGEQIIDLTESMELEKKLEG